MAVRLESLAGSLAVLVAAQRHVNSAALPRVPTTALPRRLPCAVEPRGVEAARRRDEAAVRQGLSSLAVLAVHVGIQVSSDVAAAALALASALLAETFACRVVRHAAASSEGFHAGEERRTTAEGGADAFPRTG